MGGIYFWNYKKLALALNQNTVSKKQFWSYVLLALILWLAPRLFSLKASIEAAQKICIDGSLPGYDLVEIILVLGFLPIWLLSTYIVNRRGDGKNYVKRFICIYVPTVIRTAVFFLPVGFLLAGIITEYLRTDGAPLDEFHKKIRESWEECSAYVLCSAYFLTITIKSFLIASGQKTIPVTPSADPVHDRSQEDGGLFT